MSELTKTDIFGIKSIKFDKLTKHQIGNYILYCARLGIHTEQGEVVFNLFSENEENLRVKDDLP